jgi:hypothetical protein
MLPRILHYNIFPVIEAFKHRNLLKIFTFLGNPKVFNKYEKFGMNRNALYDRSGAIPHYLNMAPIHPMPNYDSAFNKSFYDVVEERAKEIIALQKPIKVCWSGGLDSTFVLFTLLNYANDKSQIEVYGTYSSVIESGDVFDLFIKDNIRYNISIYPTEEVKNVSQDCIWVTGFQGNQLFGPTDNFFAEGRETAFFHHTLGNKKTIYEDYRKNVNLELLEFIQPAIDASPRKIETIADLRWYCIFNMDWYNGLYAMKGEMTQEKMKSVYHFFDTIEFQKWAIHTKDPWTKIPGNPNTHRWQMREALTNYGLEKYAREKTKAISCFSSNKTNWYFLLENYENIYL